MRNPITNIFIDARDMIVEKFGALSPLAKVLLLATGLLLFPILPSVACGPDCGSATTGVPCPTAQPIKTPARTPLPTGSSGN